MLLRCRFSSRDPKMGPSPHQTEVSKTLGLSGEKVGTARFFGFILALLPVLSFVAQLILSRRNGTEDLFYKHVVVTVVDWVFVPFNYFVVRIIDWRKGVRLYAIFCGSALLNVLTHAYWQRNGLDLGHMITQAGVMLPAGWAHLVFSIAEMALLVAFVFCRDETANTGITSLLAVAYFIGVMIGGIVIH